MPEKTPRLSSLPNVNEFSPSTNKRVAKLSEKSKVEGDCRKPPGAFAVEQLGTNPGPQTIADCVPVIVPETVRLKI